MIAAGECEVGIAEQRAETDQKHIVLAQNKDCRRCSYSQDDICNGKTAKARSGRHMGGTFRAHASGKDRKASQHWLDSLGALNR